uniref:Ig-like domain-containing protein n=1 Tax=Oreochromis niloticus TaxID=8128 RepID=A0A669EG11_ORENI
MHTGAARDRTTNLPISSKPTVTLQPSWTQIYSGETVTVRCEIQGGEGAQWTYEWRAAKLNTPTTSNEYRITVTESDSGGYSCQGRRDYFFSEWSDIITLTVSCKLENLNLKSFVENYYSVISKMCSIICYKIVYYLYYAVVNSIFNICVQYSVLNQSIKVSGFG